jgi:hypothetical protein
MAANDHAFTQIKSAALLCCFLVRCERRVGNLARLLHQFHIEA